MSAAREFIAIAGNPNSGKTTAFNWYTGARQHVGNYPGITVEKKEGTAKVRGDDVTIVDLPGTYSLTAYSLEEVVARRVLAEDRPGAVLNIVNAAVLERNLYLAVQMLEMGLPVVLALNMMDEAKAQGVVIDSRRLEELTGMKAVPTVARTGEGLTEALEAAVDAAQKNKGKIRPLEISYGPDIDEALNDMIPLVEEAALLTDIYPARWVALKYLESDEEIMGRAALVSASADERLTAMADKVAEHIKTTLNSYPEAIIADYRYGYISSVLRQGVLKSPDNIGDRIAYSDKMDMVLTNRFFGPLIMLGVLYAVYFFTIEIGDYPLGLVESGFAWLEDTLSGAMGDGLLKSMLVSGVVAGVGGVLGFVPLIMIMFMLITILEDSGYMARVAYMMDRVFRFFGLHGASIMPFIISGGIAGGCAVPGIMATRTLRSPRERLATMLTAPFMTCGAKIPVFLLLVTIFFEQNKATVMFLLTMTGWLAALLVSLLLRSTLIRGEATPFVMELPPYRLPTLSGVLIHTWERTWQYIKKAGTIILAISILIWAGMTFPGLPDERAQDFAVRKTSVENRISAFAQAGLLDEKRDLQDKIVAPGQDASDKSEFADRLAVIDKALEADSEDMPDALKKAFEDGPEELKAGMSDLDEQLAEIGNEEAVETLRGSYAGRLGIAIEPFTAPAGFDWRTNIALIGGIAAKEVVISTLGTAYSLGEIDEDNENSLADRIRADENWTKANAVALLLFTLLYSPCFVTLAVIKKESGQWRWMFFSLVFNLALAYGVAVAANQLLSRLA